MHPIIVISAPSEIKGEAGIWVQLLQLGLQRLHIRKPGWNKEEMMKLIEQVPLEWRTRLVVHHHPDIMKEAKLGGVHYSYNDFVSGNGKNNGNNKDFSVSCSVHHWHEMERVAGQCDYAFISPVFDSISKNGYRQNNELQHVPDHLRHCKLFALGGVDDKNMDRLQDMGYYGAALLGYIWKNPAAAVQQLEKLMVKHSSS